MVLSYYMMGLIPVNSYTMFQRPRKYYTIHNYLPCAGDKLLLSRINAMLRKNSKNDESSEFAYVSITSKNILAPEFFSIPRTLHTHSGTETSRLTTGKVYIRVRAITKTKWHHEI